MGTLRITSGQWRGRTLRAPEGQGTRPMLTRVRKSLADILRPQLPGATVLDLFGGSGAAALELLSNGAARATVVELDSGAAERVRENARSLGAGDRVRVLEGDALEWIAGLDRQAERFDVILAAPPYGRGLQQAALDALGRRPLAPPGGLIVVQREVREPAGEGRGPWRRFRTRTYGRTAFEFYRRDP